MHSEASTKEMLPLPPGQKTQVEKILLLEPESEAMEGHELWF